VLSAGPGLSAGSGPDGQPQGPAAAPADQHGGRGGSLSGLLDPRWEWWNDADVQKQLGLAPDKVHRIDGFYEKRIKDTKSVIEEFVHQLSDLDAMARAATVDETTFSIQVRRVESLRSLLNESRTMMLYRIYRELQPDQYKKLQEIIQRRANRNNGRGRG
jgi:Spy/CpxP family protein refolding chaperone